MIKKRNWKPLLVSLIVVYATAFIGGIFTSGAVDSPWYQTIRTSITPPNWVFPIVWNILFFLIALSIYFLWTTAKNKSPKKSITLLFGMNLVLNAFWSYLFFGLQNPRAAFIEIIVLWISIISLLILSYRVNKKSFYLLLPYFLWVSFACILNAVIAF